MDLFHPTSLSFYLAVALSVFSGVFMVLRGYFGIRGGFSQVLIYLLITIGWLGISAYSPNFYQIESLRDYQLAVLTGLGVPLLIMTILVFLSPKTVNLLPQKWLTFFQVLRILIELSYYGLFIRGFLPQKLTFMGMNADLLIALFSPVIAMYYYSNHSLGKFYAYLYHASGLISLIWICYLGFYPSGHEEQGVFVLANPLWFEYPWIWHWTFLIPLFLMGHALSIYLLIKKPSGARSS